MVGAGTGIDSFVDGEAADRTQVAAEAFHSEATGSRVCVVLLETLVLACVLAACVRPSGIFGLNPYSIGAPCEEPQFR